MKARIVDTSNRAVFDDAVSLSADRFAATHASDYRLELPVERLERGEYLLTIEAARGQYTAGRAVGFTVR